MTPFQSTPDTPMPTDMAAALAMQLQAAPLPAERTARLRSQVLERVHRSAVAHRPFATVRREDAPWLPGGEGVQTRRLSDSAGLCVQVLKLAPGCSLPWPQGTLAQELLVLEGELCVAGATGLTGSVLTPMCHLVVERTTAPSLVAGCEGATVYVRQRAATATQLPTIEAQWWASAQGAGAHAGQTWEPYREGVQAWVLHQSGTVASMLIKIAPGASLPDHGHSLDEDCYMIDGTLFLGDILMRAGDYQGAPVGCQHMNLCSDAGGVFYFHGGVPTLASE